MKWTMSQNSDEPVWASFLRKKERSLQIGGVAIQDFGGVEYIFKNTQIILWMKGATSKRTEIYSIRSVYPKSKIFL